MTYPTSWKSNREFWSLHYLRFQSLTKPLIDMERKYNYYHMEPPNESAKRISDILMNHEHSDEPTEITEMAMHTLGVGVIRDGFAPIIKKGTALPARREQTFTTSFDFQKGIKISIYRGDADVWASLNTCLSVFMLNLTPMPRGEPRVVVHFHFDEENMLILIVTIVLLNRYSLIVSVLSIIISITFLITICLSFLSTP